MVFTLIITMVITTILNDFIVEEVDSKDSGSVLVRFVKKLFLLVSYLAKIDYEDYHYLVSALPHFHR